MKRLIILSFIVMTLLGGCARKESDKQNPGRFEGAFSYEKRVILDMIDVLKRYNSRIFQASTAAEMTTANNELSDKLEILNPEIIFVTEKHPDWGENPPDELKTIIEEYINAHKEFNLVSLDLVKAKIEAHPEDEDFVRSYERLNYITTYDRGKGSDEKKDNPDSDGGQE